MRPAPSTFASWVWKGLATKTTSIEKNAATIRGANVDYAEMVRKAKRMLAEKKKIPL